MCSLLIGFLYPFSEENSLPNKGTNRNSISNEKTGKSNATVIGNENNQDNSISDETTVNKKTEQINGKIQNNKNIKNNNEALKSNLEKRSKNKLLSNSKKQTIANKKHRKGKRSGSYSVTNSLGKQSKNSGKSISESQKTNSKETLLASETQTNTTKSNAIEDLKKRTPVDSLIASTTNKKIKEKDKKEEESLVAKDSITEIQEKSKKYEIVIAPYYGINYGGYFGNFNAISENPIIENKAASRDTYGILARWMFDERFGFQLGVGKINSRYFTTIEKTDYPFINTQNVDTEVPIGELNGIFANETKVKFTYESSYIEVPIEFYYILKDRKFGAAASLGFSLLFEDKNSIFAESDNVQKLKIGTLTTNQPTSITGNAKLYLFYKISPSLHFDLYPTFQYRIMGDTNSSNYSSYFFSIRTGLSYKL